MRPVEHTMICFSCRPSAPAVATHMRFAFSRPGTPVQAFALPAFATIARTSGEARRVRETRTGAAFTLFVVKVPAATAFVLETMSAMSGALLFAVLMPQ